MTSVDLQLATPPEPLERRGEDLVQAVLAAGVLVVA